MVTRRAPHVTWDDKTINLKFHDRYNCFLLLLTRSTLLIVQKYCIKMVTSLWRCSCILWRRMRSFRLWRGRVCKNIPPTSHAAIRRDIPARRTNRGSWQIFSFLCYRTQHALFRNWEMCEGEISDLPDGWAFIQRNVCVRVYVWPEKPLWILRVCALFYLFLTPWALARFFGAR